MAQNEGDPDDERALASAESQAAVEAAAEPDPAAGPDPPDVSDAAPRAKLPSARARRPKKTATEPGSASLDTSIVRAEHVDLHQGGAGRIDATSVTVTQGGASRINAHDVTITMGGAGLVRADTLRAGEGSSVMAVLARRAHVASGSRVLVLISRHSSGDVRPILDWRSALAGVVGFVLLRRLLGRRADRRPGGTAAR